MTYSATDSAFEGFKAVRRNPMTIVAWSLVYIVFLSLGGLLAGPILIQIMSRLESLQTSGTPTAEMMQSIMGLYFSAIGLILPLGLLAGAVLSAGVARAVLRPEQRSFGGVRLGMDEVRVLVVSLILGVVVTVAWTVGMGAAFGIGLAAFQMSQPLLFVVAFLVGLAAIVAVAWLSLRLSLAVPIIVAERRWAIFDSFALTKSRVFPLLGMGIIAFIMSLIVSVLGSIVTLPFTLLTGPLNPATLEGLSIPAILQQAWPAIIVGVVLNSILSALQVAVLYAPFSAAYLGIKGLSRPGEGIVDLTKTFE